MSSGAQKTAPETAAEGQGVPFKLRTFPCTQGVKCNFIVFSLKTPGAESGFGNSVLPSGKICDYRQLLKTSLTYY